MRTIAHRGASAYAPENTAAAFALAITMGAEAIETDVQITRDGHLVLFHDETVDRTSDGQGPLADFTLAELRVLDVGSWFGTDHVGSRILTPDEGQNAFGGRIPFVFEIKDPLAALPFARWIGAQEMPSAPEVTSFSWSALLAAQSLTDARYGFLTPTWDRGLIERTHGRGFAQICPHVHALNPALITIAHDLGLDVRAWGVQTQEDVELAFSAGADGVTSNWPDWILQRNREQE